MVVHSNASRFASRRKVPSFAGMASCCSTLHTRCTGDKGLNFPLADSEPVHKLHNIHWCQHQAAHNFTLCTDLTKLNSNAAHASYPWLPHTLPPTPSSFSPSVPFQPSLLDCRIWRQGPSGPSPSQRCILASLHQQALVRQISSLPQTLLWAAPLGTSWL